MVAKGDWEVVSVLVLLLLVVGLLGVCVASVWPGSRGSPGPAGRTIRSKTDPRSPATTSSSKPESLEGVLVSQLAAGEITSRQYLRTMESLAAREDERNPMSVPSDGGTGEAGQ
jgi:hypothetical protein